MKHFCLEFESNNQDKPCEQQCSVCEMFDLKKEGISIKEQAKKYAEGVQDIEAYKKALKSINPDKGFIDFTY